MPPRMISHYRVVRQLGAGGMGAVFLAEDTRLDRSVAVKLLPGNLSEDASRRKRFVAEAKAASALNHSNVCTIYEVGETAEGQPFLAMEYLEGLSLDALARSRRLELHEIVGIGLQVADALEAARQQEVVHRDIKPGNIVVLNSKIENRKSKLQVKVVDFGLAKRLDQPGEASALTQEGAVLGTPNYLSPELALGREVDCRSDIFSLGVVLYELAAGRNPFAGASFGETVNNILNRESEPLRPWNPGVTPEFERIVRKCLEKDIARRYATPQELAADLRRLEATLDERDARNGKTVWMVAAGGLAACLLALAAWQFLRPTHPVANPGRAPATARTNSDPIPLSRQRLVVLPFKNLASGEANEVFTEGLAVELFSKLSQLRGLQVIDGAGFVKSQGAEKDFAAKWRELNAGALLRGTVLKEQKQLRIRLQLLDSQTQEVLKTFDFDREPESVLALQSEAAEVIATALQVQLLADDRLQLSRKPTENPRAYQAYLEGRAFWNRYTEAGWRRSIELFNDAIRLDPNFALAYAGLADSYVQLSGDFLRPSEGYSVAKGNARRAIELQPDLAPAYVSLAQCQMWFDRDYPGARQSFETALRLAPRYPDTYHFYAHYYEILGQMPRALELLQQAIAYDPLASVLQAELGWAYYHDRRYGDGATQARQVLASEPAFEYARCVLGMNLLGAGQYGEAIPALERCWKSLGWPIALGQLGYAYGRAGKTQQARETLQQLQALEKSGSWVAPSVIGLVRLGLGETNQALAQFERAVDAHDVYVTWILVEPQFDSLRNEPRYQAILRKMNLVPASTTDTSSAVSQKSVAVLPFVNMSAEKNDEYLSDGMTEELLNALGRIPGLRVPGRSSSFAFKGRNEEGIFRKIGEKLQVETVLEGSVRKAGDKLRVTAKLINVENGFQVWSDTYDRDLTDIFSIQSDIASRVAEALKVQLLGGAREPTPDVEAYKLYLQGRHLWNGRTGAAIKKSIEIFNQAIAKDPASAAAYAGLADSYAILGEYASLPRRETLPRAEAAALKALKLDSTLAEPHAVLGWVKEAASDWSGAEQEYRQAINLNPRYATAYHWYSISLRAQRLWDQALAEIRRAQDADPLSPVINVNVATHLYRNGHREQALKMLLDLIELEPAFALARNELAWLYVTERRPQDAIAQLDAARPFFGGEPYPLVSLGPAYALAGRTNDAQKVLLQLCEYQSKGHDLRIGIARVQYALGDTSGTLDTLERALPEHAEGLDGLNYDPFWDDLRSHPRVQAILKKMNLVQ